MPEYMIMFNDEWVREHTGAELADKAAAAREVLDAMRADNVLVYTNGGTDKESALFHVQAKDGEASFTDGPFDQRDQFLGGLCVIDVADDEVARAWAGRLTLALDWPQEVHRFRGPGHTAS